MFLFHNWIHLSNLSQKSDINSFFNGLNTVIGVVGLGTAIFVALNNWYNNERKIPTSFYEDIIKRDEKHGLWGQKYCICIKKNKGEGLAKSVRGFITIENTQMEKIPLLWDNNNSLYSDIGDYDYLNLFSIQESKDGYNIHIPIIPSTDSSNNSLDYYNQSINRDTLNSKIIITIDSENARWPKQPHIITLKDVVLKENQ